MKDKHKLYQAYLTSYLSVMGNTPYYDSITIIEPFAGTGKDNDDNGSALIAAECIHHYVTHENRLNKRFRLRLNELDDNNYQELKKNLEVPKYKDFVRTYKRDARDFISGITRSLREQTGHSLVFIDPYGYTQYSQQNIRDLLKLNSVDYLIFIPTTHIHRFIGDKDNAPRKFLIDFGVPESALSDITSPDKLANHLKDCFKNISKSDYVYSYHLKTDNRRTKYHLVFITKHKRGAEKFLKAREDIQDQLSLFSGHEPEAGKFLGRVLENRITNEDLYDEALKFGLLAKPVRAELREMQDAGKITVECGFERRRSDFYLAINPSKIIYIQKVKE